MPAPWESCRPAVGRQDAEVGLGACAFLGEHNHRFPALCRAVQKWPLPAYKALAFAKLPVCRRKSVVTTQEHGEEHPCRCRKDSICAGRFTLPDPAVRFTLPPVARCILSTLYPAFCSAARRCRHLQHVYCAQLLAGHTCLQTLTSHG